jgi:hypothetical protein
MLLSTFDRSEQIDMIVRKFEQEKAASEPRIHRDFLRRRLASRMVKLPGKPKKGEGSSTLRNQPDPNLKVHKNYA